jgi:CheY-like chemotaxis protein/HPt (histidine-containing phosphotransfer) domain-containing protein
MPDVDGFMLTRWIRQERPLARTRIVMLTSIGHGEGAVRGAKAGVDAYLSKPVKHSDLLDALCSVIGASTRYAPEKGAAKPEVGRRPRRALKILVAEDNPVNRKLAITLLKKRRHKVTGVENGRLAVEAIRQQNGRFDVVLMDLQMPEMGGIEATAAIRASEAGTNRHLPIIALTAHAMQGDRDRCLAAGMDDYLSKPIDVTRLISTVERLADTAGADTPVAPSPETPAIFDEQAALACVGGDRGLLAQVVATFRTSWVDYQKRIEAALDGTDAEALRMSAHALKGAIATLGSVAGREAAIRLEQLAREGDFDAARSAYSSLRSCITRLDSALVTARHAPRPRPRLGTRRRQVRPARRRS